MPDLREWRGSDDAVFVTALLEHVGDGLVMCHVGDERVFGNTPVSSHVFSSDPELSAIASTRIGRMPSAFPAGE